ncbi:hypothetical protein P8C59_000739 [Phyllachora maydis]|uniref:Glucose-methanol-choline oxidoreductase N-terminal domain-containing protein n=2 Tax=Phyllachora maydis TaxID=1825666 RepID=A0AAD9MBI3_9PEZI|nr:hypothetical protein P8C59_000739 [Phyllachora maydis]
MTTKQLSAAEAERFDYVIVGGGTAGSVVAARLAEYLPQKRILLVEAGPSDFQDDRVLDLRQWLSLLGGELDYDYMTVEQPMEHDLKIWQSLGVKGWSFAIFMKALDRLRNTVQPVHAKHRNQLCKDWVESCSKALNIPVVDDFNREITAMGALKPSTGFLSVAYNPDDGRRSSASVAYLHPILRGDEPRPNLTILTNAWVSKINVRGDTATGVHLILQDGSSRTVAAKTETILCAGAIDTPRLLLLSGLGPAEQLSALDIEVVKDLAGIGMNLQDHPETIIMWELKKPVPAGQTTMDSDAAVFLRREPRDAARTDTAPLINPAGIADGDIADCMMHCYQIPFALHTSRLGYSVPPPGYAFCMTPNIMRPRSRGRLYLTSADPTVKPALDFGYFTDPEGYDAATLVYGIKEARKVAQQSPFRDWIKKEVAPGPQVQTDEDIGHYARKVAHTVYHPVGTTRMGDVDKDAGAVVDSMLRVKGVKKLRIADAGIFPTIPSVNPMLTVLGVGEMCAEMLAREAGETAKL